MSPQASSTAHGSPGLRVTGLREPSTCEPEAEAVETGIRPLSANSSCM